MLKLLHCADLHLDIPFDARDAAASALRRQQLRETLSRVVDVALEREVDLLLIAGDLFERSYLSHDTSVFLLEQLDRLAGHCRVVITPGNHDFYHAQSPYATLTFPKHVHIFHSEQLSCLLLPELRCRVFGYAFCAIDHPRAPLADFVLPEAQDCDFSLLCAHTEFGNPLSQKAPILSRELEQSGFDYAALGHIHRCSGMQYVGSTHYAYCGSTDGLDFGNCGKKTMFYVELEKNEDKTDFRFEAIPTSPRHYEILPVRVDGVRETADLLAPIHAAIQKKHYNENTALRIILEGEVSVQFVFSQAAILSELPPLLYAEVQNNTRPALDRRVLEQDIGIRGALYRALLPQLQSEDSAIRAQAARALQYGLCALSGEEFPKDTTYTEQGGTQ